MGTVPYTMIQDVSSSLFRLIRGVVRDREEALDLTQDVLLRLIGRSAPDDPSRFKGYAMRAAYHSALNSIRDRKRQVRFQEQLQSEPCVGVNCASEGDCPDGITLLHLRQALAQLPAKQREAIEFRFYGGLTVEEISRSMDISQGSVKVHLFRGLNRLNEIMTTTKEEK